MSEQKEFKPTKAQEIAGAYKGSDLLISAGAGSGKTETLINRIADKVTRGKEDISRKLIVTFTKDAANELKERINGALSKLLKKNPDDKHIGEQLVRLGSADICTIDSFCLKLVKAHFEQLGLDGGFRIADESESEVLSREAISEVLDRFYEEHIDDESFLRIFDCFSSFSNEEILKDELLELYKKLITTKNGIDTLLCSPKLDCDFIETPYGKILKEHLKSFAEYYRGFFGYAINEVTGTPEDESAFLGAFSSDLLFLNELIALIPSASYAELCEKLASYNAQKLGNTKKASHSQTEFFKEMRDKFKEKRKKLSVELFSSNDDVLRSSFKKNEQACRALHEVICAFDLEYAKKKKSAGVCDFNDISRHALRLLYDDDGSVSPLAQEIALSYDEVYVDEYQDTNYVQDRIFFAISKNNRFLVGDIKQSIYRFRSAEPEIFSSYRGDFEQISLDVSVEEALAQSHPNGASLFMSENFRCDKSVIDFSNKVTSFMLGNSSGIPFSEADDSLKFKKLNCNYESDKVEIHLIDKSKDSIIPSEEEIDDEDEGEDDEELLRREAEFVADRIQELLAGERLANGKEIGPSDITILLRGFNKPVELYSDALKSRGIDFEYRGDEHFFEKSEILLTLCVLNAIDNPLRDVYLAGAMRSAVFGFSLEEMIQIRGASDKELSFFRAVKEYPKKDALRKKIDAFLERLNTYRLASRKMSSYEIIAMIYADTGLITMANEGERRNLLKLYDIARSYEAGKYKGLYGFLRYVEGIKESSGKEQIGSLNENRVRLMSVHASKGLQFEVCFVAGCGAKMNVMDASDPILYHRDLGVCAYVSRDDGIARFNTVLRRSASVAIKRASIEEEMRMLYVAMTRARSKLIISAGVPNPKEFLAKCDKSRHFANEFSVLNPKGYIDWILQAVLDSPELAKIKLHLFKPKATDSDVTTTESKPITAGEALESTTEASDGEKLEFTIDYDEQVDENSPFTDGENGDNVSIIDDSLSSAQTLAVEKDTQILKERFEYEYPFSHLAKIPSKLSVSKLYPEVLDNVENDEIEIKYTFDDVPDFARQDAQKTATGADKGTATHVFLQFCNFDSLIENGTQFELDRLLNDGFISESTKGLVNVDYINSFAKSALLNEQILKAKAVHKELRFNVLIDASELSKDESISSESVLVQGVCDCVLEMENGDLVLIDYKTDLIPKGASLADFLKERYGEQLKYYRMALKKIFGRPVSKALIYHVPFDKTIPLSED